MLFNNSICKKILRLCGCFGPNESQKYALTNKKVSLVSLTYIAHIRRSVFVYSAIYLRMVCAIGLADMLLRVEIASPP